MASPLYLLDTNVLLACIRGGKLGKHIQSTYRFDSDGFDSLVCVVSIGEIFSLARKFGWGTEKINLMRGLVGSLITVDINAAEVLEAYAVIDHFSETNGHRMGKNDVWIAAVARITGSTLLTTDPDFDHLDPAYVSRIWIDPAKGK